MENGSSDCNTEIDPVFLDLTADDLYENDESDS